jgi:hypothetical protein
VPAQTTLASNFSGQEINNFFDRSRQEETGLYPVFLSNSKVLQLHHQCRPFPALYLIELFCTDANPFWVEWHTYC